MNAIARWMDADGFKNGRMVARALILTAGILMPVAAYIVWVRW